MKGKIFNAQEVQAIISGNKTQFREVIKPQPNKIDTWERPTRFVAITEEKSYPLVCPYQVGQKIFCKESFADFRSNNSDIFYKSDFEINNLVKVAKLTWKPAQHMKQEHSRLTLQIKSIGVERLGDISEEDAIAEGCKAEYWLVNTPDCYEYDGITAREDFAALWDETHKKPEEKFEANPFVWCVDFKIIE